MNSKTRAQVIPLRYMLEPWLKKEGEAIGNDLEARRAEMLSWGINGDSYVKRFQQVLDSDSHLLNIA